MRGISLRKFSVNHLQGIKFIICAVIIALFLGAFLSYSHTFDNPSARTPVSNGMPFSKAISNEPHPAVSNTGACSGTGQNLSAIENAQSTNASIPISLPTNTSSQMTYIDTPTNWTGYQLFSSVSALTDNRSWLANGTLEGTQLPSPWQYEALDTTHINNNTDIYAHCWGWYNSSAPGTSAGALFLSHGYDRNGTELIGDYQNGSEYCCFNQTIPIDRGSVTAVKVSFAYNVSYIGQLSGWDSLFISLNGFKAYFNVFTSTSPSNTWATMQYDMPVLEIPSYFNLPSSAVTFKIGIHQVVDNAYWESQDEERDQVTLTNISMDLLAAVKPTQVQLSVNGTTGTTSVSDNGYGAGNVTLQGTWPNLSSSNYQPTEVNFTVGSNASTVQFLSTLTQWANHSRTTQTAAGVPGTEFTLVNGTGSNWTAYFYASTPTLYTGYNFTIFFPSDWSIWALYDPSPSQVLTSPGISWGGGLLDVSAIRANAFPGLWTIDFNSPNYITAVSTYRNTTIAPGPGNWALSPFVYAGDLVNITAQLSGSQIGTVAQLEVWFPNGTTWPEHAQIQSVGSNGMINFSAFKIPASGPEYLAGAYTIFVSWNNTVGATPCNETGLFSTALTIRHYAIMMPVMSYFNNVINGTSIQIQATYNDTSGGVVTGATLSVLNFANSIQLMTEIAPGYYSTDVIVAITGSFGFYNLTISASHPYYSSAQANVTLGVILNTTLTASIYPTINVQSKANFTVTLNYRETSSGDGIDTANPWIDYGDAWTLVAQGGGSGNYILTGNTSLYAINSIQQIAVGFNKFGDLPQNLTINLKIVPRNAVFQPIYFNNTDFTLLPSITLPITTRLNVSVGFDDELLGTPLLGASLTLTGTGFAPISLTANGANYSVILDTNLLGLGVHFLNLMGNQTDYALTSTVLQVTINQIQTNVHTNDSQVTYSVLPNSNFTFRISVDDLDFGGAVPGCTVTYEWRYGNGTLNGPDANGYYSAELLNVPAGTWTITVRVSSPSSDFAFNDLTITLIATQSNVGGFPQWLLYIFAGAFVAVIGLFIYYERVWKYPLIIRKIRKVIACVKRGKPAPVGFRSPDSTFAEPYLVSSKQYLTLSAQNQLITQFLHKKKQGIPLAPAQVRPQEETTVLEEEMPPVEAVTTPLSEAPSEVEVAGPAEPKLPKVKGSSAAPSSHKFSSKPTVKPLPPAKSSAQGKGKKPKVKDAGSSEGDPDTGNAGGE